jgi:predicted CopG family antitoxin
MYVSQKKTIAVSLENYKKLKKYGEAGDSLNLAISRLLESADDAGGGLG